MRRVAVLVLPVGLGFVLLGLLVEWLVAGGPPLVGGWIDLAAGWTIAACGIAVWAGARDSRVGPLLVAAGLAWFIGTLAAPTGPVGRSPIGWAAGYVVQLHVAFLVHAIVTWPSGRLVRPTQLALVVGGYIAALFPVIWYRAPGYTALGILLAAGLLVDRSTLGSARRWALRPATAAGVLLAASLALIPELAARAAESRLGILGNGADLWAGAVTVTALILARASLREGERGGRAADLTVELHGDRSDGPRRRWLGWAWLSDVVREPSLDDLRSVDDPAVRAAVDRALALDRRNQLLRASLAAQIDELEASRRRLVEVGDEERRALEERLRTGASATLAGLAVAVTGLVPSPRDDVASTGAGAERPGGNGPRAETRLRIATRLARAADQIGQARLELEAIAAGLDPGRIGERGLDGALRDLASRSPVPVELSLQVAPRIAPSVATTCYFVASEALANIIRHARASAAWLQLRPEGHALVLVVEDDGVGGADPGRGSGLRGLQERLEALGGTLGVDGRPGGGTRLAATIPDARLEVA